MLSHVPLFVTSRTVARQVPLSMGFSRQEHWSGLHSLLHEIFPTQGSNLGLLHCRRILYQLSHQGSPPFLLGYYKILRTVPCATQEVLVGCLFYIYIVACMCSSQIPSSSFIHGHLRGTDGLRLKGRHSGRRLPVGS